MSTDLAWQRLFAASGLIFAVLCGIGLEVVCPQPPDFDASSAVTALYYVDNRSGFLWMVTLCGASMAFLLAWSIQLGAMLWRHRDLSRIAVIVAIVSLAASPVLLSFDLVFFGIAAYRAGEVNSDVILVLSDVAWIGSMLIWPQLCVAMAMVGVLILQQRGGLTFPRWLGWYSLLTAAVEPFQLGIVFAKDGAFGPRGWTTWYAAVATWGIWIVALSIVMVRGLEQGRRAPASEAGSSHDTGPLPAALKSTGVETSDRATV